MLSNIIGREKTLDKGEDLKTILDPKIQFVEDKVVDELTGLSLQEIWRYCRSKKKCYGGKR